jgi:hypothetical protein
MKVIRSIVIVEDILKSKHLDETNLIWSAIMRMDIIDVYKSLENTLFVNPEKQAFLEVLDVRFKKHRFLKDEGYCLKLFDCNKLHKNEVLCEFIGCETGLGMTLFFEHINGKVRNISFCNCYSNIETLNKDYGWE